MICLRVFLRALLGLVLALCLGRVSAARLDLPQGFQFQALGPGVAYLEDPMGLWTLADVLRRPDPQWAHNPSDVPTLGYSQSAFWFKFAMKNRGPGGLSTLLEIAYPMLNHVNLYVIQGGGTVWSYPMGSGQAVAQRPYPHRNFVVPIDLAHDEEVEVLLRVQTTSSIQVPIMAWSPQAFLIQDNIINILYGAYLGLVVIMFAYNLKLLIGTGDRNYLYYICWVTGMAGFVMCVHGLSLQYLWPGQVHLNDRALVLLVIGICSSAMMFSVHFLDVHVAMPQRLKWMHAVLLVNAGLAVGSFLFPYSTMIRLAIVSTVIITAAIGQMSIQRWMQGYRPARYFAISFALVLLGGVAMSLSKFGLIPRSVWTEHSVTLGSALEIVLLNLALADRYNGERQARERAQSDLFDWQQKHNDMLEAKVAQRTKELELANWQLQQYVNRMARLQMGSELGATLIHELRQPLAAIQSFAQGAVTMMRTALDADRLERVLGRIVDTSKKGNVMLDRMRAFLTQDNESFQPFDLHDSVREALVWLRPTCQQEGVVLDVLDADATPLWAQGDGVLAQQVIVNLLRNAVDAMIAAPSDPRRITVTTFSDSVFAHCRVTDTGPGLPDQAQDQLFESCFTTKPNGMGIGLKLSRSIAREMRGDLTMEPASVGASFLFSIPLAKHAVSNVSAF
ncbi:MAG: hypothetical protein KGL57_09285 [Burkholderiales bacterium]|nr:hypothetical protein [Burkholderiales bacterium]